jgi:hypothetical protein
VPAPSLGPLAPRGWKTSLGRPGPGARNSPLLKIIGGAEVKPESFLPGKGSRLYTQRPTLPFQLTGFHNLWLLPPTGINTKAIVRTARIVSGD